MAERYALVAGSGDLVRQVVAAAGGRSLDLTVHSVVGPLDFAGVRVVTHAPDDLVELFGSLREAGATHMLLAGYVSKATWDALQHFPPLGIDPGSPVGTAELARRLETALPKITGAKLVRIHDVAPELIAPDGPIAGANLPEEVLGEAIRALRHARELGWRDLGQAVVVFADGAVEAEDAAGTDALLSRVAAMAPGRRSDGGRRILAKALKPGQPLTMDVPVIGPATVENAWQAGVSVIAVEAGGAVVVDRAEIERVADKAGISVVGIAF